MTQQGALSPGSPGTGVPPARGALEAWHGREGLGSLTSEGWNCWEDSKVVTSQEDEAGVGILGGKEVWLRWGGPGGGWRLTNSGLRL